MRLLSVDLTTTLALAWTTAAAAASTVLERSGAASSTPRGSGALVMNKCQLLLRQGYSRIGERARIELGSPRVKQLEAARTHLACLYDTNCAPVEDVGD